jgi:hypothetical protein
LCPTGRDTFLFFLVMAFQPPPPPQGVVLTTEALLRFAPGRFLKDSPAAVNSLDFHRTEELLVVASDDDSLRLYDLQSGTLLKTLLARAAGARLVTFTHAPSCVLTAAGGRRGSGTEHEVRYHSFHDNTYLRFFKARSACTRAPGFARLTAGSPGRATPGASPRWRCRPRRTRS